MKKEFVIFLIMILSIRSGYSQNTLKDTININEVVVTGAKNETSKKVVPMSVSQISNQDIENSGQSNVLPVLNTYVPGIFVTERNVFGFGVSTNSAGSISIRGVSGSPNTDVLVLIDGHPQYQGIFGHPLSDVYVTSDVDKVEIIRGPASLLYGSNAMAGVINIITKQQHEDGFNVGLGVSYGSFNTQKYDGTIGYKYKKLSVFVSLDHDHTDGIRPNTDFTITNGYTKIGYEINKHFNLTADFNLAKFNANDNGPDFAPDTLNMKISRGEASLSLENKFDKSEGAIKVYDNFGTHDISDGWHSTDHNSGLMLYQTFNFFAGNKITLGSDFKQYGGTANQGEAADTLKIENDLAFYAYTQQTFLRKLTLSAGLRFEHNAHFGNEFVPMAGLAYNPTKTTTFKGSVSKGFRSPTIMELYLFAPNPNLKPESMVNYELSWLQTFFNENLSLELTAYKAKGSNLIQVVGIYPNIIRENVGAFSNHGIEFSTRYVIAKDLYINANYSYLYFDQIVIAAPQQQMNLGINYKYKICSINITTQRILKLYTSIQPAITQDYTLLNARLNVRLKKKVDVFVAVNNILNQKYEINYGYPMPGINYNTGLNVRFK